MNVVKKVFFVFCVAIFSFFVLFYIIKVKCINTEELKIEYQISNSNYSIVAKDRSVFLDYLDQNMPIQVYYKYRFDTSCFVFENNSKSNEEAKVVLHSYRETVKNAIESYNILDKLNMDLNKCVVSSSYSPYLYANYESVDEYFEDEANIIHLSSSELIEMVYVTQFVLQNNATIGLENSIDRYDYSDALDDIGYVDNGYYGSGINVGIWEANSYNALMELEGYGYIDGNLDSFEFRKKYFNDRNTNNVSSILASHASVVGIIACGNDSIANDCSIFSSNIDYSGNSYLSDLDWFCDFDVMVINCSFSYAFNANNYTILDSIIDYYSRFLGLIFSISSGNKNGNEEQGIQPPALSLNSIVVGATDINKDIAYFTCTYSGEIDVKPLVSAPGANLYNISNDCPALDSNGITNSGTSFSAPMITSVITLLLDEFPHLIGKPEILMSALAASSVKLPSQVNVFDSEAGAGIINYERARTIINKRESYCTVSGNLSSNSIIQSIPIQLSPYKEIKLFASWLIDSTLTNSTDWYHSASVNCNHYLIELRDANTLELITYSSNCYYNLQYCEYLNVDNTTKDLIILIRSLQSRLASDPVEHISLCYDFRTYDYVSNLSNSYFIDDDYKILIENHSYVIDCDCAICEECNQEIYIEDIIDIDLFDYNDSLISFVETLTLDTIDGYNSYIFNIHEPGSFVIDFNYIGNQTNNLRCFLGKIIFDTSASSFNIELIDEAQINYIDDYSYFETSLDNGSYIFACLGFNNDDYIDIAIVRILSSISTITTDVSIINCGSEIKVLEINNNTKSFNSNIITKGFTRKLFLIEGNDCLDINDFYWYIDNSDIAILTDDGYILALNTGIITIMAISKDDYSTIFYRSFSIINASSFLIFYSNINISNYDMYNCDFNDIMNMAICPYNDYIFYDWIVDIIDPYMTVSINNGAIDVSGIGLFSLIGNYYLNSDVVVVININVINHDFI